ncbi:chaplin family protein [Streptomyces sp. NPDC001508]|uniref:chaplin n=1 Tax=Streptomyces sp. NPDC001508 TaxID=3154656 RepID=UPI00332E5D8A
MRKTLSRGVVVAAAATSVLSLCDIAAVADSEAGGTTSGSPGVLSGNTVQAPVHVPVNVCGNTVDVIALLNPAFGNSCVNGAGRAEQATPGIPGQVGPSDSGAQQTPPPTGAVSTPPVARPPAPRPPAPAEHIRSDSPSAAGTHDSPPTGSTGITGSTGSTERQPGLVPMGEESRPAQPALAETGSASTLAASGLSAALIAGGVMLYRRGRAVSVR